MWWGFFWDGTRFIFCFRRRRSVGLDCCFRGGTRRGQDLVDGQGGLGILSTYTKNSVGKDGWMDLYWQWVLGLNVPLGSRLSIQANAYYVFESWSRLNKFAFDDVEFGGFLTYKF